MSEPMSMSREEVKDRLLAARQALPAKSVHKAPEAEQLQRYQNEALSDTSE